jgi:hypothetical protein
MGDRTALALTADRVEIAGDDKSSPFFPKEIRMGTQRKRRSYDMLSLAVVELVAHQPAQCRERVVHVCVRKVQDLSKYCLEDLDRPS